MQDDQKNSSTIAHFKNGALAGLRLGTPTILALVLWQLYELTRMIQDTQRLLVEILARMR